MFVYVIHYIATECVWDKHASMNLLYSYSLQQWLNCADTLSFISLTFDHVVQELC